MYKVKPQIGNSSLWSKSPVIWHENGKLYASVVFTWQLNQIPKNSLFGKTIIGGPAAKMMGISDKKMKGVLEKHNPNACFTTRGCIRSCPFCAVPKIEGAFKEIKNFIPRPIICDNNFLASSKNHFNRVIDKFKLIEGIDFNQGLDSRLITKYHANRLAELKVCMLRFAWDSTQNEPFNAIELARKAGFPKSKIRVYVLIGYKDSPEDALYRLETLRKYGVLPSPMRYQPINTLKKNSYVDKNWTHKELIRFMRYWARLIYTNSIPFKEFNYEQNIKKKPRRDQITLTRDGRVDRK